MQWTVEQAWTWYRARPWLCGFNYVPSTAVNSTEIWQRDTWDPATIDRELSWARDLGFNCCRIFVQYLVWDADPRGLLQRMDKFLDVAQRHGLATMFVLFDDCAFARKEPHLGPQDEPIPGVHNSGWTPSPGHRRATDPACWPRLQQYITDVIRHFAADPRVLMWDLYNEPGNSTMGAKSLPLLHAAFDWARSAKPTQPLTVAVWNDTMDELNEAMLQGSDIVSFHDYNELAATEKLVARLRTFDRPLVCTEWMRRNYSSHFETHLPYFKREQIGAFFWGLVNGRTQTHFPWGSAQGALEPQLWFHDLLNRHGQPHRPEEVALIRELIFGKGTLYG